MAWSFRWTVSLLCLWFSSVGVIAADKAPEMKEWTFLLFLNGHNNLDSFSGLNLNQMEQVGSTDQVNLVVQWASSKATDTKRLYMQKDADMNQVTSPVIQSLPRVDMGDYKSLVDFVKWGMEAYPAKHYFIDIWNHGSGWKRGALKTGVRDISNDDFSSHKITTEQLGVALAEIAAIRGGKIDVVGADACLMAMIEVVSEMTDSVQYFLASQEVEPADGWPYHKFLESLAAAPQQAIPAWLAVSTAAYAASYEGKREGTLSAMDLSKVADLNLALQRMGTQMVGLAAEEEMTAVQAAAKKAKRFYYYDYMDIGDFMASLDKAAVADRLRVEMTGVKEALGQLVVSNHTTSDMSTATGVSVWWPYYSWTWDQSQERYSKLKFAQASGWHNVLEQIAVAK